MENDREKPFDCNDILGRVGIIEKKLVFHSGKQKVLDIGSAQKTCFNVIENNLFRLPPLAT